MDVFENRGCWGVSWRVTLYPRAAPTFLSSSKSAGTIDLLCPYSHLLHVCGWSGIPSGYYRSTASPLTVHFVELLPSWCVICPYCDPSRTSIDVIFSVTEPADLVEWSLWALPFSKELPLPQHWSLSIAGYMTSSDYILILPFGESRW